MVYQHPTIDYLVGSEGVPVIIMYLFAEMDICKMEIINTSGRKGL